MSFRSALRTYVLSKSEDLGSDVLLSESEHCITIFDKFPKAKFHFLILPKPSKTIATSVMTNLATFLRWDKEVALEYLHHMKRDAETTKSMIEDEMMKQHGFHWDILIGFHAVPSMDHVHLHVLSSDLCSSALKKKHHYNSFRPDLGFFLHLEDVLKWFDFPIATPFSKGPTFESKVAVSAQKYEVLLKRDLECFKCRETFKTVPQLKIHLQKEWDEEKAERAKSGKRSRARSPGISPRKLAVMLGQILVLSCWLTKQKMGRGSTVNEATAFIQPKLVTLMINNYFELSPVLLGYFVGVTVTSLYYVSPLYPPEK